MTETYLNFLVMGGLGNQLFIIAAAFHLSDKFILVRQTNPQDRPKQWDSFFADCPAVLSKLVTSLPQVPWSRIEATSTSSTYIDHLPTIEANREKGISTIIESYFQNLKYLPSQERVRDLFNIREKQQRLSTVLSDIDFKTTCAIHFRLGDYKWITHHFILCPDSYYKNGIESVRRIKPEIKTILVVNEVEDQHTVEERMKNITLGTGCQVRFLSRYHLKDWEEMIVMSLCSAIVMANSTFSWWSAYFADESTTVVYPAYWHHGQGEFPEHALALPGWIKGCS